MLILLKDQLEGVIGAGVGLASIGQGFTLAQIVVQGDGLSETAQLVLVGGLVACQLLAVLLVSRARDKRRGETLEDVLDSEDE